MPLLGAPPAPAELAPPALPPLEVPEPLLAPLLLRPAAGAPAVLGAAPPLPAVLAPSGASGAELLHASALTTMEHAATHRERSCIGHRT
jgi:hypothetical protein